MSHTLESNSTSELKSLVWKLKRENMRQYIHNLLLRFMKEKSNNKVKLHEFKKWLNEERKSGNPRVLEAQSYYVDSGFTGSGWNSGPWCNAPYFFWEFDRLNRWLANVPTLTMSKENNRIMLTQAI